jgi:hypothetical protein
MSGKKALENVVPSKMSFTHPSVESMYYLSVESLYNYIRFFSFPTISEKEKKALLLQAYQTPLKRPEVFVKVVEAVKSDDFELLKTIVREHKVDVTKEVADTVGSRIKIPDVWPMILDAYFEESASGTAVQLLTYLISFPILDKDMGALKYFIENYKKANDEERERIVGGYINARHI